MQAQDVPLGYFAHPDGGPCASLVLVHDVWGLSEHARDFARRFAHEGFGVLALDLYRAKGKVEIQDPGSWMRALSDPEVLKDVHDSLLVGVFTNGRCALNPPSTMILAADGDLLVVREGPLEP